MPGPAAARWAPRLGRLELRGLPVLEDLDQVRQGRDGENGSVLVHEAELAVFRERLEPDAGERGEGGPDVHAGDGFLGGDIGLLVGVQLPQGRPIEFIIALGYKFELGEQVEEFFELGLDDILLLVLDRVFPLPDIDLRAGDRAGLGAEERYLRAERAGGEGLEKIIAVWLGVER